MSKSRGKKTKRRLWNGKPESRRLNIEQLENRRLLAINLVYPNDLNTLPSADLRLQAFSNGGTPSVRLVTSSGNTTVASAALDASGIVNIRRDDSQISQINNVGDTIRINLASLASVQSFVSANGGLLTVNFNGGDALPLINTLLGDDQVIIDPIGSASNLAAIGMGLSLITTADIEVNNVHANFTGNLTIRSDPTSSVFLLDQSD